MHTTWRLGLAHGLLAAGGFLALLLAYTLTWGNEANWIPTATWGLVTLLFSSLVASSVHFRRAERFRRHLTHGLTHHLRTSLAHVLAYDEMLLLGNDSSDEEQREWLEIIGREAERVGVVVENALFVLGHRGGTPESLRRRVDLGAVLEDVASDSSSRVEFEVGPPVGIFVHGDPDALRHALTNLFHGLGRCRIQGTSLSATLRANATVATIEVGADGDGAHWATFPDRSGLIPDVDSEASGGIGFGLELAMVQHVARAHGGRAGPLSKGAWTGYRLELPLASA